ncbi:hypothetical protein H2248_008777 [Termitomyces sp. 'cryptogamus']|nr:hypothetical protein H2248_008777 [Termitomyces sp. 'cryptogamus']
MFSLCSESSSRMEMFSHENPYIHSLDVAEKIYSPPHSNDSNNIDIFDNPFIPNYPIAYVPSDFSLSMSSEGGRTPTSGMDPSVWRVLPECEATFVRPEDLVAPLKVTRAESPSTSDSDHRPLLSRLTLDEFMSSMEIYCTSPTTQITAHTNGQSTYPKTGNPGPISTTKRSYACPFPDCSHACNNRNDLQRHLSCREHKEPSVPCPKQCGAMFTRKDSAKRHGNSCTSRATNHI